VAVVAAAPTAVAVAAAATAVAVAAVAADTDRSPGITPSTIQGGPIGFATGRAAVLQVLGGTARPRGMGASRA